MKYYLNNTKIINILSFSKALCRQSFFELYVFTELENEIGYQSGRMRDSFLAGRFAAKTAVSELLNTYEDSKIHLLKDIEIQRLSAGCPIIVLSADAKKIAHDLGITSFLLTISHSHLYAAASVLALFHK
jgi:holo-[acyl-carrier protein] synthase